MQSAKGSVEKLESKSVVAMEVESVEKLEEVLGVPRATRTVRPRAAVWGPVLGPVMAAPLAQAWAEMLVEAWA